MKNEAKNLELSVVRPDLDSLSELRITKQNPALLVSYDCCSGIRH